MHPELTRTWFGFDLLLLWALVLVLPVVAFTHARGGPYLAPASGEWPSARTVLPRQLNKAHQNKTRALPMCAGARAIPPTRSGLADLAYALV